MTTRTPEQLPDEKANEGALDALGVAVEASDAGNCKHTHGHDTGSAEEKLSTDQSVRGVERKTFGWPS